MITIAEWAATATPDALRPVLEHRPDVRAGAPLQSRQDLADRLVHEAGVVRALGGVPEPGWQVLTALGVLGGSATVDALADVLGGASPADVAHWCEQLALRALVVPGTAVDANPTAVDVAGTPPGLGPTARAAVATAPLAALQRVADAWGLDADAPRAELVAGVLAALRDPAHVRRVTADAPLDVTRWLLAHARHAVQVAHAAAQGAPPPTPDELLAGPASFRTGPAARQWALDHGLAFPAGPVGDAVVPCEVVVALGGPLRLPFDPQPPPVPTAPVEPGQVDATAAAAVADVVGAVGTVLDHVRGGPVAVLASGGVGAREVARVARATGESATAVRVALELGAALGLLTVTGRHVTASDELTAWRRETPAAQAVDLWAAWLDLLVHPTCDRDEDGAFLPVLARGLPVVPGSREAVLGLAAAVTDRDVRGAAVLDVAALGSAATWSGASGVDDADARTVWQEATLLGLVALGCVTPAARALLAGDLDAVRTHLDAVLPPVATTAHLGSDLTAVVTGVPSVQLTDLLDLLAERETRCAASTWRFSAGSVRRAFDAGWDVDDVLARLTAAAGDIPQPLEYLVRDVARRHGHVTVRRAACVLVVPDDALRAELVAARALRGLHLRPVDGAVLASTCAPDVVLDRLRGAGYLPVEVGAGGVRVVRGGPPPAVASDVGELSADVGPDGGAPAAGHVAASPVDDPATSPVDDPAAAPPAGSPAGDPVPVGAALQVLLGEQAPECDPEADRVYRAVARHTRRLADVERRHIAWAVARGGALYVEYRSGTGTVTRRVVSRLGLLGPYLTGWCHLRGDDRHFRLDGVELVAPVVH